jgi:hypothetical protein
VIRLLASRLPFSSRTAMSWCPSAQSIPQYMLTLVRSSPRLADGLMWVLDPGESARRSNSEARGLPSDEPFAIPATGKDPVFASELDGSHV